MATNTTVLIVSAAVAVLLLVGMAAVVMYQTRTRKRPVNGDMTPAQAKENVRRVRYQESLADVYAVKAHALETEVDIKSARAWRLQRQAAVYRSEEATSRVRLNEQKNRGDQLYGAPPTAERPRFAV